MSWAQCSACEETFNSDHAFDRHRIRTTGQPGFDPEYDWRCASEAELRGRGWSRNAQGRWITAQMGDSARDRRTRTTTAAESVRAREEAS